MHVIFVYARKYGMVKDAGGIKTTRVSNETFFYRHESSANTLSGNALKKLDTAEQINTNEIYEARDKKQQEVRDQAEAAEQERKKQSRRDKANAAEFRAQQEAEKLEAAEQEQARNQACQVRAKHFKSKAGRDDKNKAAQRIHTIIKSPPYDLPRTHPLHFIGQSNEFAVWWETNNSTATVIAELMQYLEDWDVNGLFEQIARLCGYREG